MQGTKIVIVSGNFKGVTGVVVEFREADQSYRLELEGENPQVRWFRSEFKPL